MGVRSSIYTVAVIAILSLLLLTCDQNPAKSTPPNDTPPFSLASITIGSDVPDSTLFKLSGLISALDSTAVNDTSQIKIPQLSSQPLVMAVDSSGDAILAGFGSADSIGILNVNSTALALTEIFMLRSIIHLPDEITLQQLIKNRPEYSVLVDTVRNLIEAGKSFINSEGAVLQAAAVAESVIVSLPTTPVNRTPLREENSPSSTITFDKFYQVSVEAVGTTGITLSNASYATFGLTMTHGTPSESELPGKRLCLLCIPPSFGILPEKKSISNVPDGLVSATIEFGPSQKNAAVAQFSIDAFVGILRACGATVGEEQYSTLIGIIGTKVDLVAAATQGRWEDAGRSVVNGILANRVELVASVGKALPKLISGSAFGLLLRNIAKIVVVGDFAFWVGDVSLRLIDVKFYWNKGSETKSFCFYGGTLYTECVDHIIVDPFLLDSAETKMLTAKAYDSQNNLLPDIKFTWSSSDSTIAQVVNEQLTGLKSGTVIITVAAMGKEAEVSVTINTINITGVWHRTSGGQEVGNEVISVADSNGMLTGIFSIPYVNLEVPLIGVRKGTNVFFSYLLNPDNGLTGTEYMTFDKTTQTMSGYVIFEPAGERYDGLGWTKQ